MAAIGIIYSNIHDQTVPRLTRERTMASIPFGGRYRLIDFVLSSMVNAGIGTISVITKTNYQSLMNHIGRGKDWDLDRKTGGLMVLSPFDQDSNGLYTNRLEALKGTLGMLRKATEQYVVMADCDILANFDLATALRKHEQSGADVSVIYKNVSLEKPLNRSSKRLQLDETGRVRDLGEYQNLQGDISLSLDIWILGREYLIGVVEDAIAHGYSSLVRDVWMPNLDRIHVHGIEHEGYFCCIDSMEMYLEGNLKLLDRTVRKELFDNEDRPVFTKVKDSPPTKYGSEASVKNSMIADGCIIEGTVENSVLFRGVKVGRNTVVRNSVLMQDTITGENVSLNYVVTDKRVVVKDGRNLSGYVTHPFYIAKNSLV